MLNLDSSFEDIYVNIKRVNLLFEISQLRWYLLPALLQTYATIFKHKTKTTFQHIKNQNKE